MTETLYRKYRPQKWADLIDQNHIKTTLKSEISSGKIAHAYLFAGPRGVGKTTVARIFAKCLNCENLKTAEPCEKCKSCISQTSGQQMALIEIDAASARGIDDIRELREQVRYSPGSAKYKVYIIDEVHMLTIQAFNALLKTLEEPPAHAIFILATTEAHKIPQTIISRCQRFNFRRVAAVDMMPRLSMIAKAEKVKVPDDVLRQVIYRSDGCVRDAESLLGQIIALGGGDGEITMDEAALVLPRSNISDVIDIIDAMSKGNSDNALQLLNKMEADGVDMDQLLSDLIEHTRRLMMMLIISPLDYISDLTKELGKKAMEQSKCFGDKNLSYMLELWIEATRRMGQSSIHQLPIELAIVKYGVHFGDSSPIQAAVAPEPAKSPVQDVTTQVAKPVSASPAKPKSKPVVAMTDILNKWKDVMKHSSSENRALFAVLRMCKPTDISGNVVTVTCPFELHKDALMEQNKRSLFETILEKVFGRSLTFSVNIGKVEMDAPVKKQPSSVAEKAAAAFGGDVIE